MVCNYKGMCVVKTMRCKYERDVSNMKGMCPGVVENWVMIIRKNYDKILFYFFILEKLKKKANLYI